MRRGNGAGRAGEQSRCWAQWLQGSMDMKHQAEEKLLYIQLGLGRGTKPTAHHHSKMCLEAPRHCGVTGQARHCAFTGVRTLGWGYEGSTCHWRGGCTWGQWDVLSLPFCPIGSIGELFPVQQQTVRGAPWKDSPGTCRRRLGPGKSVGSTDMGFLYQSHVQVFQYQYPNT